MSIYSETTTNAPRDETHLLGENCYTCNNNCPGIILEIFKEGSFEHDAHVQYLISSILVEDKGYYLVKYSTGILNEVLKPCLALYTNEASKFLMNIAEFGYGCIITKNDAKNYLRNVFITDNEGKVIDPKNLLHVFRELEVI